MNGMEMVLQVAGVVVPCFAAGCGLFAWGMRRMDRRFEEARQDRVRIESKLDARCDRIEGRCDRIEGRCDRIEVQFEDRWSQMEAKLEDRWSQMEAKLEDRWSQMDRRIDRLGDRVDERSDRISRQITELNREVGKLQGIAGTAWVQEVASGSG